MSTHTAGESHTQGNEAHSVQTDAPADELYELRSKPSTQSVLTRAPTPQPSPKY
jgi:hypothetical protein